MANARNRPSPKQSRATDRILSVAGYKSVRDETTLRLRPLTLIAGVNSSGKSSFMQPFLLLKQTLEASYDTGPLMAHGPNVQLASWGEVLSRGKSRGSTTSEMRIGIQLGHMGVTNHYEWSEPGLSLTGTTYSRDDDSIRLGENSKLESIRRALEMLDTPLFRVFATRAPTSGGRTAGLPTNAKFTVVRDRCFLEPAISISRSPGEVIRQSSLFASEAASNFRTFLSSIIHVPGLRGNPLRTYTSSAAAGGFPGTIEKYVASIISRWQSAEGPEKARLRAMTGDLERLGLTWKVHARRVDDASVELRVGRLPHAQQGGANDLVNIADVGFGVSQTLPVLVALHAADPGQTVYIEQPEIHLHPRAQVGMGNILVDAANRGVFVVVETHSSLVLRAIQTAIAQRRIPHADVAMNWFFRSPSTGFSKVKQADLDEYGRFGDWPVDFDDVAEQSDWEFVQSVQKAAAEA